MRAYASVSAATAAILGSLAHSGRKAESAPCSHAILLTFRQSQQASQLRREKEVFSTSKAMLGPIFRDTEWVYCCREVIVSTNIWLFSAMNSLALSTDGNKAFHTTQEYRHYVHLSHLCLLCPHFLQYVKDTEAPVVTLMMRRGGRPDSRTTTDMQRRNESNGSTARTAYSCNCLCHRGPVRWQVA